ncbi:MAG TPA: hypothetical protein VEL76_23070 [Gemmataceae bacterium]|nr:hypothetical protein [Gemmataceae bacterium]
MVKQSSTRRLSYVVAALGVFAGALLSDGRAQDPAQTTLRWGRNDSGNAQPILLSAREIITWKEGSQRVLLLRGSAFIGQGVTQARMQQAVVWLDEERKKTSGIYYLDIYAEGDVTLTDGPRSVNGDNPVPKALLQLATRGEIPVKSWNSRIATTPLPRDPLYLTAALERSGRAAAPQPQPPPSNRVMPAGGPGMSVPSGPVIQRVAAQEVAPPPAPVAPAPVPVAPLPAPVPRFQPVQGPAPVPAFQPVPPAPAGPGNALPLPPVPPVAPNQNRGPQPAPEVAPLPRAIVPEADFEEAPLRSVIIRPRSSLELKAQKFPTPSGEAAVVVTNGVIIHVNDPLNKGMVDIEADRVVFWTRDDFRDVFKEDAAPKQAGKRPLEFYLSGHVEIRQQVDKDTRILRAEEVYYDVNRSVAICLDADLEVKQPGLPDPLHLQGPEIYQLNAKFFKLGKSSVNASKLPYGPGLQLTMSGSSLEEIEVKKRGLLQLIGLGQPKVDPVTGQEEVEKQRLFRAKNVVLWIENIPIFYVPYVQGDVNDPLGPLQNLMINYNRIFGFQTFVTLDVYDLLGMTPTPGTRWRLNLDYMSRRGPALGTDYIANGKDLFDIPNKYDVRIRAYGLHDRASDILGGNRGQTLLLDEPPPLHWENITHPEWRGWLNTSVNVQELPCGFTFQSMINAISDRNFIEQYFPFQWNSELNLETFLYLKQQQNNWAWTALLEPNLRNWITETIWAPKVDGYLLGEKLFGWITTNTSAGIGWAHLQPTHQPPVPISITDQNVETGRLDFREEVSVPFTLGAIRWVPYAIYEETYYTEDLERKDRGRAYIAGGLRSSMPLSQLFPDASSELLNIHGLYHKILFSSNYFVAHSDTPYTILPQLDRLNDDASDQALRNIKSWQPLFNPGFGKFLITSPAFDPQTYAIRTLIDNRVDTLNTVEVLQGSIFQRLQTKRGYPGQEHVIDWMTLDLSGAYFPHPTRDNFGESFAFLKYDYKWHIGDRLTVVSDGWYEPLSHGTRTWMAGVEINRPDSTMFSFTYREIDPLLTRMVTAVVTYPFSYKYSVSLIASYDFGNNIQMNGITLTRYGTDLQVNMGLYVNSVVNTVSFTFEVFPNLLPGNKRVTGASGGFLQSVAPPR